MNSQSRPRLIVLLCAVLPLLAAGCNRAVRDGIAVGLTQGLSDGVSQVIADAITSVYSGPAE